MLYMIAIWAILHAGSMGLNPVGMTTTQVSTAQHNYVNHSVLPTTENTNQPPIPRKVPARKTSFGRMAER